MKKLIFAVWTSLLLFGCATSGARTTQDIIAYDLVGEGTERVIVMHDWLGDRSNYDGVLDFLDRQSFTYVFVDLRGYGESKNIAGEHTAAEASADIIALADKLGWDRFHIVGHSMTGMVVQRVAIDAGDRIKSVVAVSPVAASGLPVDDKTWNFFVDVVDNPESTSAGIGLLTGNKLSQSWVDYKVGRAMSTSTAEARRDYLDMFVKTDFSDESKGIKTPFLLLLGANDLPAFTPDGVSETFMQWYPNAQIELITDTGHYSMQETPALFVSLLESFLADHSG